MLLLAIFTKKSFPIYGRDQPIGGSEKLLCISTKTRHPLTGAIATPAFIIQRTFACMGYCIPLKGDIDTHIDSIPLMHRVDKGYTAAPFSRYVDAPRGDCESIY